MRNRMEGKRSRGAVSGLAVLLALLAVAGVQADKGLNDGIYRDREDRTHSWSLERSHLLVWEEKPYAPGGLVFHSEYLRNPSNGNLAKDRAELDQLKAAGVLDVWVEPGRGLLEGTPAQTQALVDELESRGFRYGLRVGDRTRDPLIGFSPTLPQVRVPAAQMQPGSRQRWTVRAPGARRVIYTLVESPDRKTQYYPVATDQTLVENGTAEIQVQIRDSRLLGKRPGSLLVVPELQIEPEDLGSFGDLWTGMDRYHQRLKAHLQAVRFGPGLRFILDPFAAGDGSVGQEDMVFPSSDAFRKAFEEWLTRRIGLGRINIAWRMTDRKVVGMAEAARLVPMWPRNDPPEGDGWLFDPEERVVYQCNPRECSIWRDLDEFRATSLKRWMNVVTSTLKQEGLNVPMLFTWSAYHPVFTNSPSPAGYDGLATALYGTPEEVRSQAAYALGQVEEADRNSWLIAARLAGPRNGDEVAPLRTASDVRAAWESVRSAGVRGFYLDPKEVPGAQTLVRGIADPADPALKEVARALYFPMALSSSDRVTRFPNGVWWLPSGNPARLLRYGDRILAYEIAYPFGQESVIRGGTVLWSASGKQEVTFWYDRLYPPEIFDSAGKPVKVRKKKGDLIQFDLTEEPVVAYGAQSSSLFPIELAQDLLQEFDDLLKEAEAQRLNSATMRPLYTQAVRGLGPNSAASVYVSTLPYVERLRRELASFVWIEAERPSSHNLTGMAFQAGSSEGLYLRLDRANLPVSGIFKAEYVFHIPRDASYEIWLGGRMPGKDGASPLVWQIDDEPAIAVSAAEPQTPPYAGSMAWTTIGRMTLKAGRHELRLVFPDPGSRGRYVAALDAIVFGRDGFKPKGVEKPYARRRAAR